MKRYDERYSAEDEKSRKAADQRGEECCHQQDTCLPERAEGLEDAVDAATLGLGRDIRQECLVGVVHQVKGKREDEDRDTENDQDEAHHRDIKGLLNGVEWSQSEPMLVGSR